MIVTLPYILDYESQIISEWYHISCGSYNLKKAVALVTHDEKIKALQYVVQLKNALEMEGAIVLVSREAIK